MSIFRFLARRREESIKQREKRIDELNLYEMRTKERIEELKKFKRQELERRRLASLEGYTPRKLAEAQYEKESKERKVKIKKGITRAISPVESIGRGFLHFGKSINIKPTVKAKKSSGIFRKEAFTQQTTKNPFEFGR